MRSGRAPVSAALGLLLCACAASHRPASDPAWYKHAAFAPPAVEAEWARYHWYVADVDYDFRTRDTVEGGYKGPVSYADLHLVVKALDDEGAQIGTLSIPYWNQNIHSMRVVHLGPDGAERPVDQAAVLAGYKEKGSVVLPNVARGSVVAVHIRQGPFLVLDYWEYPMQGLVPAWRSRFRFSYPQRLGYAWKGYNGLAEPKVDTAAGIVTSAWSASRILPLDDVPFLDPSAARPRLAITSRNAGLGQGLPDWPAVAALRTREHFAAPGRDSLAKALAGTLTAGAEDDSAKADLLLTWVQDNVAWDPEAVPGSDWGKVAEARKGDLWQLSGLLQAMYAAAGLESEILLTRGRDQGGFDADMVTPAAAWEPVVAVRCGGRTWAALPHARSYGLGDYPATLYGLQALSLRTGTCLPLPAPRYPEARIATDQDAVLPPARERNLSVTLEGPWAGMARTDWYDGRWPDLASFCRSFLDDLGFTADIAGCAEAGMEARNRPLILEVTVSDDASVIERGGVRQASWPRLFSRPAWFYDSTRADAYGFPFAQARTETVRFLGPAGARLDVNAPCKDAHDGILNVECARQAIAGGTAVTRTVRLPAGRFEAAELARRHADFQELDRIGELKATARPEAPQPKPGRLAAERPGPGPTR